jgi:ureidoglycolate amidohydrolase
LPLSQRLIPTSAPFSIMQLSIDRDLLIHELETLAGFSDVPAPAVTRIVFTQADIRARNYIKELCRSAGLEVREDPAGNTFARWTGEYFDQAAVATGSHIDAIPNAGRYDGTVGVLGGLEAIRALKRSGFRPKRPIELIIFTSEEPTRFGIGCLGSRLLSGNLDTSVDAKLRDKSGKTLGEVRKDAGFAAKLENVCPPGGYYSSFLELHIEQGPLLEREQFAIGVVTAIAGPATLRILVEGQGGHAGGVLMPDRRDALCAAAEIILAVESAAKSSSAIDTVGTTGVCDVFPSAVNSIPSRVELQIDVRDIEEARRERVLASIKEAVEKIGAERRVGTRIETLHADAPGTCDPRIVEVVARGCTTLRLPFKKMVSRAYHDSLFMSRIAPTAMIFIPCRGGVSHRPDEFASPEAIANGTAVLARALADLAI